MPPKSAQKEPKLPLGSKVDATVQKILPMGLSVELSNGRNAMIRQRELTWSRSQLQKWESQFQEGQKLQAIVLSEEDGYLELSVRLAEDDPWEQVKDKFEIRQLVEGVVTGIEQYGAFIELAPGLTGLLHHTKLPPDIKGRIGDLLWVGDHVKVCVESIDPEKRRISLSMNGHRTHRWQSRDVDRGYVNVSANFNNVSAETAPITKSISSTTYSIVIVEDDEAQQQALSTWIQSHGHAIHTATNEEDGYALVEQYVPDIVFSDVGLPDGDGIRLLDRLRKRYPTCNYVLMTDWLRINQRMADLSELKTHGVQFLVKPLLPEDIENVFGQFEQCVKDSSELGEPDAEFEASLNEMFATASPATESTTQDLPAVVLKDSVVVNKELRDLLSRLQQQYAAHKVVLFCLDSRQRQIRPIAEVGKASINRNAEVDLIHSPVRNVAEDKQFLRIDNTNKRERFIQNLVPLLNFQSCLGIPIEGRTHNPWALFFFFQKPDEIEQISQQQSKIISMSVRALLEQQELLQRVVEMQQMSILGVMARGFVHEVNHHLSPLIFGIDSLMAKCQEIADSFENDLNRAQSTMENAGDTLSHLNDSVGSLAKTARSFAEMTLQGQFELVQIDELVERSIDLVLDTTDHASIEILYHPPVQMLYTKAKATQLQQVVVNVVLNAVQQIRAFRPTFGGAVHVWMELISKNDQSYIAVYVEDDGPGIHRQQWDQIFELGFTQRHGEGSGMGLHIARSLMEDANGYIDVCSSSMFWGTIISIEIPVVVAQ